MKYINSGKSKEVCNMDVVLFTLLPGFCKTFPVNVYVKNMYLTSF